MGTVTAAETADGGGLVEALRPLVDAASPLRLHLKIPGVGPGPSSRLEAANRVSRVGADLAPTPLVNIVGAAAAVLNVDVATGMAAAVAGMAVAAVEIVAVVLENVFAGTGVVVVVVVVVISSAVAVGEKAEAPVQEELPPPREIMAGVLVPALQQLTPPAVGLSDKPISLAGFKCIGSYTWLQGRDPVIVVPGAPRQWQDRPLPIQVRFDRGIRMLDENAYHMGSASSLVPLFRAVDAFDKADDEQGAGIMDALAQVEEGPEAVDWRDVDFVTDRNNLRKFARWIRTSRLNQTSPSPAVDSGSLIVEPEGKDEAGQTTTPDHTSPAPTSTTLPDVEWDTRQDFRIDLRLGGEKTVLMERWAICAREHVAPPKGGCRDNFVREATANAPECENGGGHYRIVQYDLDGLNMVVRWEVDTRAPNFSANSSSPNTSSESGTGQLPSVPPTPVDIEELARWDDTPTSGAAAWGAPEPAGSAFVDIDELAKWDDNTVDQAATWGAAPVPTNATSATSPIGQDSPNNNDKNNDFDAFAIWETPEDDPAAAAAAWGAPPPQPSKSAASAWGPPPSEGGAAHGAPTSTGGITKPGPPQELKVIRAGRLLPQSAVAELATRSAQYVDRTSNEDTFLQMFLTQTPLNLVAVHTRGSFDRVIRQELDAPEFAKFNEDADMMHTVQQLVALLRQVQELVKEYGKGAKLSLVCEKGNLALYSRGEEEEDCLVASELTRFEG
ncbi:uncharacterized protein TRAVEDRAFT_47047 [Trametes versicolor FP-101664 SS1]|uniref:uncharacterized protein n=1 Tax=Trametes versicolor (strain FP-101664) TaxID=717944 RepID=UPI0004622E0B|nr:uncharacterized protein TRAVEDRAFT_47047 [Trametes versicolor FP-101664 SS1]EIW59749.1 hypothetical protein TRAVEDRAFT_47047 [Trametes versicolor FP-101664 SS1]